MTDAIGIQTLFDGENTSIVADSLEFLGVCARLGLQTVNLNTATSLPKNSIIFSFSHSAAKRTFDLANISSNTRAIFCAAQVFDSSVESAVYSLNLVLSSDFNRALQMQRTTLHMLNSHSFFLLSENDANAEVTIHKNASAYALIKEDIKKGFVHSVAEFFEVHYAHMKAHEPCPFGFSGTLKISGILTVFRKSKLSIPEDLKSSLRWLTQLVADEGAELMVVNNEITSFRTRDLQHIKLLERASGPRGLKLTEFAIGVNESITNSINYRINSQMNEGVSGVHLAVGDGATGFHIDFLSPGVKVTAPSQQSPKDSL